jgi:hypothetical protein
MSRPAWTLPVAFIALVVVLTFAAILIVATITQRNIGAVDLNGQDLKVRLDELRTTLQMLIVAAGLFAIAQSASAFFNAQSFTKQADDAIKRIQEQAREAEARYPMFARTEAVRREAYAYLADVFRDPFFLDWRTSAYERLGLLERQSLLSVERFIGIELLPHPGGPAEYVRDLRRLANFYASKHRYDQRHDQAQWSDLERSEYYLRLAIREAGEDCYYLLTDLGVLYMEYYEPKRLDEAGQQFRASIRRKKISSARTTISGWWPVIVRSGRKPCACTRRRSNTITGKRVRWTRCAASFSTIAPARMPGIPTTPGSGRKQNWSPRAWHRSGQPPSMVW